VARKKFRRRNNANEGGGLSRVFQAGFRWGPITLSYMNSAKLMQKGTEEDFKVDVERRAFHLLDQQYL